MFMASQSQSAADTGQNQQQQPEQKVMNGKECNRPDSPGYFTLSDSDGASNPGTESPQEDEGGKSPAAKPHQTQHQVYKMFKSSRPLSAAATSSSSATRTNKVIAPERPNSERAKSNTPPRPSPPRGYKRDSIGDSVPPRPPPPLSYTSTLPPPVPKKTRAKTPSRSTSVGQQQFKTLPAARRSNSSAGAGKRKSSPAASLARVQPLQMQSPSMIQALTKSVSNKELAKEPEQKTFVQAFQKATETENKTSPSPSSQTRKGLNNSTITTPRPTKTSAARASSASSRSPRSSPAKDIFPSFLGMTSRSPSEPKRPLSSCSTATGSRRSSVTSTTESSGSTLKKSAKALKKSVMQSVQVRKHAMNEQSSGSSLFSRRGSSGERSKKSTPEPPKSKSPSPRRSSKSLSATAIEKIKEKKLERRNSREKCKAVKGEENKEKKMHFPNPINSLIKYYETDSSSKSSQANDAEKASNRSSGLSASQLCRLSLMSAVEINSWLSSPVSPANLDKSLTEIDVLDQYVSQMMSFTTDALDDAANKPPKSGIFISILEQQKSESSDEDVRKSVQEIIDKIELSTTEAEILKKSFQKSLSPPPSSSRQAAPIKPERARKRDVLSFAPSDDDLSHGIFTEVSFAGSFSSGISIVAEPLKEETGEKVTPETMMPVFFSVRAPPVPSPRTKRKARKELMLIEHKQNGREALELLKSHSETCVPRTDDDEIEEELSYRPKSVQDGLECLEQLCSISRNIEEEEEVNHRNKDATKICDEKKSNAQDEEQEEVGEPTLFISPEKLGASCCRHFAGSAPRLPTAAGRRLPSNLTVTVGSQLSALTVGRGWLFFDS